MDVNGDRGGGVKAAAITLIVIPTAAVAARFWCKATERRWWWDDLLILITLILSNTLEAVCIWWTTIGFGKHARTIPKSNLTPLRIASVVEVHLYEAAISFLKLTALFAYAYLFQVKRSFKRTLWAVGIIVTAWFVTMIVQPWAACNPGLKHVQPWIKGTCHTNSIAWNIAQAVINFVLDLVILALPMPILWKLHTDTKRKIGISFIFLLGYCSAFVSFARFVIIVSDPGLISSAANVDVTYTLVPLFLLSMIEVPTGIVALCIIPIWSSVKKSKLYRRGTYRKGVRKEEIFNAGSGSSEGSSHYSLLRSWRSRIFSSRSPRSSARNSNDQTSRANTVSNLNISHVMVKTDVGASRFETEAV